MLILLILYLLFLFVYLAFNVYAIFRVSSMRVKGDATGRAIFIYVLAMAVILFVSLALVSTLSWPLNLGGLF
jgi:hypothetical protein